MLTRLYFRHSSLVCYEGYSFPPLFFFSFETTLQYQGEAPLYSALSQEMERVVSHQYISVSAHCNCSTCTEYMNLSSLEEAVILFCNWPATLSMERNFYVH